MSSADCELLKIEGLRFRFRRRPVLRGVDLSVRAGEVVGLLGPNGAGKTTTFRLVAGLFPLQEGRIILGHRSLHREPLHRRARWGLGYLPQETSLFRGITAWENIALALELAGQKASRGAADDVLRRWGLVHLSGQRADTLSGGEGRRLEFARILCRDPKVLLCDEPLTGVDPKAGSDLVQLIRRLAGEGRAVLLTDHNVIQALQACDRAFLLVDGQIAEAGTAADLVHSPRARALYFGDLWQHPTTPTVAP